MKLSRKSEGKQALKIREKKAHTQSRTSDDNKQKSKRNKHKQTKGTQEKEAATNERGVVYTYILYTTYRTVKYKSNVSTRIAESEQKERKKNGT